MHRRGSGLAVGSGRILAIAFAVLLVGSVVTAPVVAAGLPGGGVASATDTGSADSPSGLFASTSLAQTEQSTTPNESDVPTLGEYQPQDVDGDGRYEDVTGDGALGQADVSVFFEYQHRDVVKNHTEYFDYSGNGKVTHGDVAVLIDVVALDNRSLIDHRWPPDADRDGLPTAFEEDVAGTDPYDANSNSTLTSADESANDVGDVAEDLNGNGITLQREYELGLDPHTPDTDADGLPDLYELNVTGTDPANADSNSSLTASNESGNGVEDGSESLNANHVSLRRAYEHDLDPLAEDTDGDGLPDAYELQYEGMNPTEDDATDDLDGDLLNNLEEYEAETLPDEEDSDGDGLSDKTEVENLDTDPWIADTDGDGLTDAEEFWLGDQVNFTDPDTDGDGVPDSEETLENDIYHSGSGVRVTLSSVGYVEDSVRVEQEPSFFEGIDAAAGPTVRVQGSASFQDASVEIPIDESVPATEYDGHSIYHWDGTAGDDWSALSTSISGGEAAADVDALGYFTVLDESEWQSATTITVNRASKGDNRNFSRDSDGDGLPDVLEKRTMQMTKGDGETFSTDPDVADTDGDGLRDREEVELTSMEVSPDAGIYSIETHTNPTTADTDGDGLSDSEEAESWEIEVVDEHTPAQTLVEQLADPETEVDVDAAFSTREVTSNPVLADSDGDGLSDGRERELLTDPGDTDTTGDGLDDQEALEREAEDPTVFTTTPPEVERLDASQGWTREDR